ncbi:MAG: hypothetical protein QXK88_01430 [Desulfurococcaceae archaeon]
MNRFKQVIYVVEKSKTQEGALEKLSRSLEELEAGSNALLIEDEKRSVFKGSVSG